MSKRGGHIIVVGSGHNGLVAAIHLARAGLDVTVLESSSHPGGGCASVEATAPGYVHDHCAGFNPMTVVSPAMTELGLEAEGVRWVNPDVVLAHPFADGTAIALHRDREATIDSLQLAAPGAGRAWQELIGRLRPLVSPLVETILSPLVPIRPLGRLLAGLGGRAPWLARRMLGSIEALGLDLFGGATRPTAWLSASAQHSGLPPTTWGSGAFGLLLQLLGQTHGWPFPAGGQGALADALARIARREGVEIRCDARVGRITVGAERVRGVRLAGGETIASDGVVSTISARPLGALLPDGALPRRVARRLRHWRYGTAAFKVDFALRAPVPWTAAEARTASVVHVAGELADLATAADTARAGAVPERPVLVVGQHSLHDRTRAPAGGHTLYVYGHVPAGTPMTDERICSRIEDQLERFAPGFRDVVLARAVRGAAQTAEENPSLVDGDLAGGVMELDQQLMLRPAPSLCRYRTPLAGLYVAGASVHPGASVHGMSGRSAARALVADRRA